MNSNKNLFNEIQFYSFGIIMNSSNSQEIL
jgi:hypothetical protein